MTVLPGQTDVQTLGDVAGPTVTFGVVAGTVCVVMVLVYVVVVLVVVISV